jgi:hypothetical protein
LGYFGQLPDKLLTVSSSLGPRIINSGPNTILDLAVL